MSRRGFGYVRRLPSKRYQASYPGPDLQRHVAPTTFTTKGDVGTRLAEERKSVESGGRRHDGGVAGPARAHDGGRGDDLPAAAKGRDRQLAKQLSRLAGA
jgi:hypothetical protein